MVKGIKVLKLKIKKSKKNGKTKASLFGIKQGVGKVTKNAFPKARRAKKTTGPSVVKNALNAMHPAHLPLPRAVGGYSVIRTTDIVNSAKACILFGAFKGPGAEFTETCWLNTIAVANKDGGANTAINATNNTTFFGSASLETSSLNGSKMVPAAITVQVMNGTALQTTNGIVYVGRSKTVLDLMGNTRTWNDTLKELVSYSAPRLCSAGKLALRGVQVNAVPNNMSVLSDFTPRRILDTGDRTWAEADTPADFEGFGPIFVYNPELVPLNYLVTIEWRMRFDPLNPAYAGHTVHVPASEATWSRVISDAEAAGNGVFDIADAAEAIAGAMV